MPRTTALSVHKNLEMYVLDAVPKDSVNGRVEAMTGNQDNMNTTVGVQDFEKHEVPDLWLKVLPGPKISTDCDSEEELQIRLNALRS